MEAKKQNIIIIVLAVLTVALIVLLAVFRIPQRSVAKLSAMSDQKKVNVYEEKIDIDGLEKPFTIFFVADAHLCLCDERDEECMDYCESRYVDFMRDSMGSEENFSLVMDYVKKQNPDLVIFGGDIVDEATLASIEYFEKEKNKLKCPSYLLMGNHDLLFNGEMLSGEEAEEIRKRYDFIRTDNNGYNIVKYDEFNILLADDYNNQVCDNIGDAIEELEKEQKSVIIAQHVPFVPTYGESDLLLRTNDMWGCAYLDYSRVLMGEHANLPNENTSKLIDFVSKKDGLCDLILAGHIHFYHRDYMSEKTVQTVTAPAFERGVIKITLY